jgi:hypothetical protein
MTHSIAKFSNPQSIPFAQSSEQLEQWSKEDIAKFGEATFDEVVQLTVIREKIYQESALIAASNDVITTRAMDRLEAQIFAPGDDAVRATYPVPVESIAPTERAEPITYSLQNVNLQMAETRYFISDDAKLRGAAGWLEQDSIRRAAEHLAEVRDKHVLTQLNTLADSSNAVAATGTWASASATPEDDLAQAISNIIKNSNIPSSMINRPQAFGLIIPAESFVGVTKLKLIRNITQPIKDFLQTEYKVKIILTRKPRVESSWPVSNDALVVPLADPSIGFLGTFDGGGIVPAQERVRNSRGEDIITKQWFKYTGIPEPLDGSTTTNARIAKITGVA